MYRYPYCQGSASATPAERVKREKLRGDEPGMIPGVDSRG